MGFDSGGKYHFWSEKLIMSTKIEWNVSNNIIKYFFHYRKNKLLISKLNLQPDLILVCNRRIILDCKQEVSWSMSLQVFYSLPKWIDRLGRASNAIDVAKFLITHEFKWRKYYAGLTVGYSSTSYMSTW